MIYERPTGLDGAFANLHPLFEMDDMSMPLLSGTDSASVSTQPTISKMPYYVLKYRIYSIIWQAISQLRLLCLCNPLSRDNVIALFAAVNDIAALPQLAKRSASMALGRGPARCERCRAISSPTRIRFRDRREVFKTIVPAGTRSPIDI